MGGETRRSHAAALDGLIGDLVVALRSLRKSPAFTTVALATLALGIGANTAVFSVIDAVLLRRLPYPDADRLYDVWRYDAPASNDSLFSYPDITDIVASAETFEALSPYDEGGATIATPAGGRRVARAQVPGRFFEVMGVSPLIGRVIAATDEPAGSEAVVVLGQSIWERDFASDPGVVGRSVRIDSRPHTVVGVMPAAFSFPPSTQIWTALSPDDSRNGHWLGAVGRLAAGATAEQARAEVTGIIERLEREFPNRYTDNSATILPLREQSVGSLRRTLLVLFAAVGAVMLIGCVNLANLVSARSAVRRREVAVRLAIGASRGRVVRQLLTESVALALAGGALGLLVGQGGVGLLTELVPAGTEPPEVGLDLELLGFSFGLALITGVLFGLAPALREVAGDLHDSLRQGARRATSRHSIVSGRRALVVAEVAIAVLLLVAAGLMVRTMSSLLSVDLGFVASDVWSVGIDVPVDAAENQADPEDGTAPLVGFFRDLRERVEALPGVESAGEVMFLPLSGGFWGTRTHVEGQPVQPRPERYLASWNAATPGYFETLTVPLVRGRLLNDRDVAGGVRVAVINETLARSLFDGVDPIGARFTNEEPDETDEWWTVVGIVGDIRSDNLMRAPVGEVYLPHNQLVSSNMHLVVRVDGEIAPVAAGVRDAVSALDPRITIAEIRPLEADVEAQTGPTRLLMTLLAAFSAVAIGLAAVGMYGVIAYGVHQRTREIGIRMALGAKRRDLLGLVMISGLSLAVLGVGIGLLSAWGATRLMQSLLHGVSSKDPFTFVSVAALALLAALSACLVPAWRATRIDPVVALRSE